MTATNKLLVLCKTIIVFQLENFIIQPQVKIVTEVKIETSWNEQSSEFNIDRYNLISKYLDENKTSFIE